MSEKKLEKKCKQRARDTGWYVRKFSSPSSRGVPDDVFIKDGRVVFIEFKALGNMPTDLQWLEMYELQKQGVEAYWCDDYDAFCELLGVGAACCQDTQKLYSAIPERLTVAPT